MLYDSTSLPPSPIYTDDLCKRSILRLTTILALVLTLSCATWAQPPAPAAAFLGDAFTNKGTAGLSAVRDEALSQSTSTPRYKSNSVETRYYEGYFQPNSDSSKLALLSDDGSSVWIDGNSVLDRAGSGQGFENFDSTFTPLGASFEQGQSYLIRIKYTNTVHSSDADVDGFTLWAYDGGGAITVREYPDLKNDPDPSASEDPYDPDEGNAGALQAPVAHQQAFQQQNAPARPNRRLVMLHHARISFADGGNFTNDGDRITIQWNGQNAFTKTIRIGPVPKTMSLILKPGKNRLAVSAVRNGKKAGCTPLITFIPQHVWSGNTSFNESLLANPAFPRLATARYTLEFPKIPISQTAYPQSAAHILAAQAAGKPKIVTCDANKPRTAGRRYNSIKASGLKAWGEFTPAEKAQYNNIAQDRDEYPQAMFKENYGRASVRYVNGSDNRGSGSTMKNLTLPYRTRFFNAKVQIVVVP